MDDRQLLAELEELLRTAPPRATARHSTEENYSWFGKVLAVLQDWSSAKALAGQTYIDNLRSPMLKASEGAYANLLTMLHQLRHTLLMALGTTGVAIPQGRPFDYFDEVRKKFEEARKDLLIIDPYQDAEFVSRYLPQVGNGVQLRLLTSDKKLPSLLSALGALKQQTAISVEVRTASGLHDRYFIVDGATCYQSGASFKDGAKNAPTTITEVTDVFGAVKSEYERIWTTAKPHVI